MATFSENQVRHLYVINAATEYTATSGAGFLIVEDAKGNPVRTDVVENPISAARTLATKMARTTKVIKVTLPEANVVAGEDYTLRIEYRQFIGQSDEEFYHEFASAHATSASTADSILEELANNLAKNVAKQGMVEVEFEEADEDEDTPACILISEIAQTDSWIRGIRPVTPVYFTVATGVVTVDGSDVAWGETEDVSEDNGDTIGNGYAIADLEWFLMGERADQYRMAGWPNYIPTDYKVDPTKTYNLYDIHYAYVGENHSVQKSEKTLTIAVDSTVDSNTIKAAIAAALNVTIA